MGDRDGSIEGIKEGDSDEAIDGDSDGSEEGVNDGYSGVVTVGVPDGSMLGSAEA